jgi:hypothetical protein
MSYAAVFKKIATFICTCCDSYKGGVSIGGMIYVQRITDMRMSGSSLRSLRIFEKICGDWNFENVVVVTTMWSSLKTKEAQDSAMMRQKMMEERPEFFGNMVKAGARIEPHQGDSESGRRIVGIIADRKRKLVLQLQSEMESSATMKLERTTAGRYLEGELATIRDKYDTKRREMKIHAEELCDDEDLKNEFTEQAQDFARLFDNIKAEQDSLSITLEDMRNQQAAWFRKGRPKMSDDAFLEDESTRISELEHKVQQQERIIMKGKAEHLEDLQDRDKKLEDQDKMLEAMKKELEETKDREHTTREEKAKTKRMNPGDFLLNLQNFFGFTGKDSRDFGPPRRADSMPVEPKTSKKGNAKAPKARSKSKGRRSGRPKGHRTFSDEKTRHSHAAASSYPQEQLNYDHESAESSDDDSGSDPDDSALPMTIQNHVPSYSLLTTIQPGNSAHYPLVTPPIGPPRNLQTQQHKPLRRNI